MLVVCVLRTPVVLVGSHAYVHQKVGKPPKKSANQGILGIVGKVVSKQTNLMHYIKANL